MNSDSGYPPAAAAEKFYRLHSPGLIQSLLDLFRQRPDERLLSFEEIQQQLNEKRQIPRGTRMIPIDHIVGSVGRYGDFDRHFLPLNPASEERWKRLDVALNRLVSLPPIEVFQLGDVYFVRDGNHRVSVARANDLAEIEAEVTEIPFSGTLTPDMDVQQIIAEAQYARFKEQTGLENVRLSGPSRYEVLLEHIEVHHYYLCIEDFKEAARSWYEQVYTPVVEAIHATGIMKEFPERSEADLYLWVAYHRERLKEELGHAPPDEEVAATLAQEFSERPLASFVKRITRAIKAAVRAAGESPEPPQTS